VCLIRKDVYVKTFSLVSRLSRLSCLPLSLSSCVLCGDFDETACTTMIGAMLRLTYENCILYVGSREERLKGLCAS